MPSTGPDNANPIVHATATTSSRRSRRSGADLDLSDDKEWARLGRNAEQDSEVDNDDEFAEDIDADEIFGTLPSQLRQPRPDTLYPVHRSHTVHHRPRTPTHT